MRTIALLLLLAPTGCSSTSTHSGELAKCNGVEVDLKTDKSNCGKCGLICAPDIDDVPACEDGVCVAKCPDSPKACISGANAQANCDSWTGCSQKCDYGYRDYDGKCSNGCEVNGSGGALANVCLEK